jgi:hypothetical protein
MSKVDDMEWLKGTMCNASFKKVKDALLAGSIESFRQAVADGIGIDKDKARVAKARARLKRRLRGEALEEAKDELKCAIDDMVEHEKQFRQAVASFLPDDEAETDDSIYESQPHEVVRKKEFEKQLGRDIEWKEYWKLLNEHYKEKLSVEQERYEESVVEYVHRFDCSSDLGGKYDSDKHGEPLITDSTFIDPKKAAMRLLAADKAAKG